MGKVLQEKFIEVGDLIPGLTGEQKWAILQSLGNVDDDTWEEFDEERNRQNRIGSHMFKSKNTLGKEQGKSKTTMERWFKQWCEMGLWADARDVEGLENDRIYNSYYGHVPENQRPTHFVFNVTWMCNLLDLRASMKSHRISDVQDERVQALAKIALTHPEESMNSPRTTSFLKDFKPRILESLDLNDDPPERWEDLYEPKKESAWAGAGAKVETSKAELSTFDYTTLEQKFAKQQQRYDKYSNLAYELPLRLEFADPEDESKRLELVLGEEHINEDGHLDPTLLKGNPGVKMLKQRAAVLQNEVEKQRLQRGEGEVEVNTFMADWDNDSPDEVEEARRLLESFNRRFSDVLMEEQQHAIN
ncbi:MULTISPECIES: hypothetical protein [Corynebacterium]|uniref:hypothetical protein n=1 Tax=Corynebacterium TaxID=1716 RepID=UPI0008A3F057|nr:MULTISPECIES: hypothetical protein [Corynebacterium]MDK8242501.1 hypothetical protein [Corynebacterium coyleae]OFL90715.1 hypothetical protein HMPREF2734_02900 [Corynebacterium sp. HMSC055D05]PLA39030.1 hypothetical protein CYJ46_01575 [Corynebacterium coyleae]